MMGTEPVIDGRSLDPRLDPNYSGGNRFQVTGRSEQPSTVSSAAVPFELRDFRDGDAQILALSGELDIATRDELQLAIEEAEETSAKTIVLDLRRLEFIDSSGIHVIVAAHQRIGERFVVLRGPQRVRRVFDLCGLTARIASADSSPRDVAGGDSTPASRGDDSAASTGGQAGSRVGVRRRAGEALLAGAIRELRSRGPASR